MYTVGTRWSMSVIKVGLGYMGIHVIKAIERKLAYAIDKCLEVNSGINSYTTKKVKIKPFKTILYELLCDS